MKMAIILLTVLGIAVIICGIGSLFAAYHLSTL